MSQLVPATDAWQQRCEYFKHLFFSRKDQEVQKFLINNGICPIGVRGDVYQPDFLKGKKGVKKQKLRGAFLGFFITEYTYKGKKYYQGMSRLHLIEQFGRKHALSSALVPAVVVSTYGLFGLMLGGTVLVFEAPAAGGAINIVPWVIAAVNGGVAAAAGPGIFVDMYNALRETKIETVRTNTYDQLTDLLDAIYELEKDEMDAAAKQKLEKANSVPDSELGFHTLLPNFMQSKEAFRRAMR